jgi:hypothetical protein
VRDWAKEALTQAIKIDSVAQLPQGYVPGAEHLLVVTTRVNPYRYESFGLLEQGGKIQGILLGSDLCTESAMYPPAKYQVAPPSTGLAALQASRRSGDALIDAVLDAIQAGDRRGLSALMSPRDGSISVIGCSGGAVTPSDAAAFLQTSSAKLLYAVSEEFVIDGSGPRLTVIALAKADGSSLGLVVDGRGIIEIFDACGTKHPEWLLGGLGRERTGLPFDTSFLLAPR